VRGCPHTVVCGQSELVAADDPDAFTGDTPTAKMVRQFLGAVAEFKKVNLVAKLQGARDRALLVNEMNAVWGA
jgi:hypothetical protein